MCRALKDTLWFSHLRDVAPLLTSRGHARDTKLGRPASSAIELAVCESGARLRTKVSASCLFTIGRSSSRSRPAPGAARGRSLHPHGRADCAVRAADPLAVRSDAPHRLALLRRVGAGLCASRLRRCRRSGRRSDGGERRTFGLTVLSVLVKGPRVPSGLLTTLMLAACLNDPVLYAYERSTYGLLPGMSRDNDLWWRISLFPFVAPSAYFALLVFFVNWLDRNAPLRRTALLLSAYFVVFSGIRSALIAGLVSAFGMWLMRHGGLARPARRTAYLVVAVAAIIVALSFSELLALLPPITNPTVNQYLYRSAEGLATSEDAAKAVYRTFLWAEHLKLAAQNPLFGIGTFDFMERATFDPSFTGDSTGSESFLTGLLARDGLPIVLLLAGFISAAVRTGQREAIRLAVGLVLFVAMLTYGSFINAYDFVFLTMLGLLAARPRITVEPISQ